MKKQVAILFISFFIFTISFSQLRTAIAGGAHIASVPGNSSPGWDTLQYDYASRTGFHFGLMADIPFSSGSKLYFQPGAFFTMKGRSFSKTMDTATSAIASVNAKQFTNYIEIPLNLLMKFDLGKKTKFILGAGPYISFLYSGRETKEVRYTNGSVVNAENKDLRVPKAQGRYINYDYGVNGLLGFEFGPVFVTGNYSRGFNDFYKPASATGSFKHQVMGATVGIIFGKSGKKEKDQSSKKAGEEKDRDGDGVPDAQDPCPRLKGTAATKGCPDEDGDGVADKDDKCPELRGSVNHKGCPAPDSDNDGLNDDVDNCPREKGKKANGGCPDPKPQFAQDIEKEALKVHFEYKSAVLSAESKVILDNIAQMLKANPDWSVTIEGYTSSDGNGRNHYRLSQARAESVKTYLVSQGVRSGRLEATGLGDANPLNPGRTEGERTLNRRVEMKLWKH